MISAIITVLAVLCASYASHRLYWKGYDDGYLNGHKRGMDSMERRKKRQ